MKWKPKPRILGLGGTPADCYHFTTILSSAYKDSMMQTCFSTPFDLVNYAASFFGNYLEAAPKIARAAIAQNNAIQDYWAGVFKYTSSFMAPSIRALSAFINTEKSRLLEHSPMENMIDYTQLLNVNIELAQTGFTAGIIHARGCTPLNETGCIPKSTVSDSGVQRRTEDDVIKGIEPVRESVCPGPGTSISRE